MLQIAIGSLQKDLLLCERRDEQRVDIRVKIPTDSVVQCVAYSKFSVCFATRQSYYVHNTEAKATHALFPYDVAVMRPIITNVGVVCYQEVACPKSAPRLGRIRAERNAGPGRVRDRRRCFAESSNLLGLEQRALHSIFRTFPVRSSGQFIKFVQVKWP